MKEDYMTAEERPYHRVWAEIDLDAIRANISSARACMRDDTGFMAIIKADGYGHGAVPIAHAIDDMVNAYGVAILEEGIELRQAGITKPILILGFTPHPLYEKMIRYEIDTACFTLEMAEQMSETAVNLGKTARVHIALDTGMSRIGFAPVEENLSVIEQIANLPGICIDGCFTHFARMDEKDKTWANRQFTRYMEFIQKLENRGIHIPVRHVSNSAGIMEMAEVHLDMVRDGICLYGLYPSEQVRKSRMPLQPAMQIRAQVTYVKTLPADTQVGYGGTYTTTGPTRVATIPVGYADGYPRALSNQGRVLIHGQSAPIIGRICMDQFMVDVSGISDVREGDLATLIGTDGDEHISVEEAADMAGSFNYEFVCDVSKRVPRVYYQNGQIAGTKDFYPKA